MTAPDMDVIKEIPGYRVILKAVLKSQIQQLVEQLAAHTEEESIILTASVSDGTLSHLGSDSGKSFLDDHEDVKSQFLGFCLKNHHRKKQKEKEKEEQERHRLMMPTTPGRFTARPGMGPRYVSPGGPRGFSPRFPARQGPMATRSPGARHEPYTTSRPQKRPSLNMDQSSGAMKIPVNNQVIKSEPDDDGSNQSAGDSNKFKQTDENSSQPGSPSHAGVKGDNGEDDDRSNTSSTSAGHNEGSDMKFSDTQPAEGLGLDSDFANLISGEQSGNSYTEVDPHVKVKLEGMSEGDGELEITGVEPGLPSASPQDSSWAHMGYDPSGATGSQADLQEGYSQVRPLIITENTSEGNLQMAYLCQYCNSQFKHWSTLKRHMTVHTGEKNFKCTFCDYASNRKDALKTHVFNRHNKVLSKS